MFKSTKFVLKIKIKYIFTGFTLQIFLRILYLENPENKTRQ